MLIVELLGRRGERECGVRGLPIYDVVWLYFEIECATISQLLFGSNVFREFTAFD